MWKAGASGVALALMLSGCSSTGMVDRKGEESHFFSIQSSEGSPAIFGGFISRQHAITVDRGDSLFAIIESVGGTKDFYYDLSVRDQGALRSLQPGDRLDIRMDATGDVLYLSRELGSGSWLVARRAGDNMVVDTEDMATIYQETRISGVIRGDLVRSLESQGLRRSLIDSLLSTIRPELDWQQDYEDGDEFHVFYRQGTRNGVDVGAPVIQSIKVSSRGRDYYAFRYEPLSGFSGYYTERGELISPGWLRHPLESFARISSKFNPRRRHPITGRIKPHNGVDFAATRGTPVYAASDGEIGFSGSLRGYGNVVKVNHSSDIETRYAHLHNIAPGLSVGDLVKKGDVIGYVGSTGWSTGPHLHYEVLISGRPQDPMAVNLAEAGRLSESERRHFLATRGMSLPGSDSGRDYVALMDDDSST